MTTATLPISLPRHFDTAVEWWDSLGDVPLQRIIFDPWPGTATEQDLLRFVEVDKRLCELINGTLVEKPVGFIEAMIALNIATALGNFVKPRKLGIVAGADATLRMSAGNIRLPDVVFISYSDMPGGQITTEPVPTLPPTLAIEVLSAANTVKEVRQKLIEYFQSGTRLAWIVHPKRRCVDVFISADAQSVTMNVGDALDGGEVLPGFALTVADIFAGVPEAQ